MIYAKKILTPAELEAIGCVSVEAASLEGFVEWAIYRICALPERIGSLLLGNMMAGGKLNVLADLVKECVGEESYKKEFALLFADIAHELANRNTIVHGLWAKSGGIEMDGARPILTEPQTTAHKPRRGKTSREFKASEAIKTAERLHAYHNQLTDLLVAKVFLMSRRKQNTPGDTAP